MSTNIDREKLRQETREARFFSSDHLVAFWTKDIERLAGKVSPASTVNEVVDILRTANLRRLVAQIAVCLNLNRSGIC